MHKVLGLVPRPVSRVVVLLLAAAMVGAVIAVLPGSWASADALPSGWVWILRTCQSPPHSPTGPPWKVSSAGACSD